MTRRLLVAACCFALVGGLAGCGAAAPEPPVPVPSSTVAVTAPRGGVLLRSLGYRFAPADLSVPGTSEITERVDQENTIVAVFTAPSGLELASWLRASLPEQGWTITADDNNSLLFERGEDHGAFTVTGALAALSVRSDARS